MFYRSLALIAFVSLMFTACKDKNAVKAPGSAADSSSPNGLKIAFVNLDSLQNSLDYFLETKKEFEAKQKAIDVELSNMQKNIQNQYQAFQRKVDSKNISQVEAENTQRSLANQGQQLQQKQQSLNNELMVKQSDFGAELLDLMNAYMAEYNKEKNYDIIFTEGPVKSVLYVNPKHDITKEVSKGMNDWIKKQKVKEAFPSMLNHKPGGGDTAQQSR